MSQYSEEQDLLADVIHSLTGVYHTYEDDLREAYEDNQRQVDFSHKGEFNIFLALEEEIG